MTTKSVSLEKVSHIIDGDFSDADIDALILADRDGEVRQAWDMFHQVGDVIRSDEGGVQLSPEFNSRFLARLDAEPVYAVDSINTASSAGNVIALKKNPKMSVKRLLLPGAAAAAFAAIAFVAAPQLMVAKADKTAVPAVVEPAVAIADAASVPQIIRDPKVDAYLDAHKGASASSYGSSQYTRSANFNLEQDK